MLSSPIAQIYRFTLFCIFICKLCFYLVSITYMLFLDHATLTFTIHVDTVYIIVPVWVYIQMPILHVVLLPVKRAERSYMFKTVIHFQLKGWKCGKKMLKFSARQCHCQFLNSSQSFKYLTYASYNYNICR